MSVLVSEIWVTETQFQRGFHIIAQFLMAKHLCCMKWKSLLCSRWRVEGRTNEKLFISKSHLSNLLSWCPFEEAKGGEKKPRSWNDKYYAKFHSGFSLVLQESMGMKRKTLQTMDAWASMRMMSLSFMLPRSRCREAACPVTFHQAHWSGKSFLHETFLLDLIFLHYHKWKILICSLANICQFALFAAFISLLARCRMVKKKNRQSEQTLCFFAQSRAILGAEMEFLL